MQRSLDNQSFRRDPIGRYVRGRTHLIYCYSPTLCGSVHWGRSSVADARAMADAFEFSLHSDLDQPFDVLMDDRAVESVEWRAYLVMADYVRTRLGIWARRIRRHAVIVPPGPVGVMLAGMVPLLGMTYPMRFFHNDADARDWLPSPSVDADAVANEVRNLMEEARSMAPVVGSLRGYFDHSLAIATIDDAARAQGTSGRSLQRELQRAGVSFQRELLEARVRAARTLLEHTTDKIDSIALQVGLSSSSRLSAAFRRVVGETPARYRTRLQLAAVRSGQ